MAKKTVKKPAPPTAKKISAAMANINKTNKNSNSSSNNSSEKESSSKKISSSVVALRRKYAEQRIAKKVKTTIIFACFRKVDSAIEDWRKRVKQLFFAGSLVLEASFGHFE